MTPLCESVTITGLQQSHLSHINIMNKQVFALNDVWPDISVSLYVSIWGQKNLVNLRIDYLCLNNL